ncbi:hypothetical protein KR032_008969, partial [Drosophila birchii]
MLQQLQQEICKNKALRRQFLKHKQSQQMALKNQELTTERNSLLQQLQREMSKSEALRQQLCEQEQSQQSVLDCVMEQNAIRLQEINDQCQVLHNQVHTLTEELDQINDLNSCPICLSPWESQGDHRIISLSCGHLFGKNCLLQHLARNPVCPLCKRGVQAGDKRYIYGCRILP